MKKVILITLAFISIAAVQNTYAQRYLNEVFTNVTRTNNVKYGRNISVLTGSPAAQDLFMDVYEPTGDTATKRPVIIYLHTGSFLPKLINGSPTGSRTDSTVVEMCTRFAKRGYVACAVSYRLGWNPQSSDQDVRTGTLLNAVYRAIQDAKTSVRFLRENFSVGGNTYKVDTSKVIVGGQGSGGYVAFAYASLDKVSELNLQKFINSTTFQPYVAQALAGNFSGTDSTFLNSPSQNHVGYSDKISMIFNAGGAIGDSSWLEAGDVPMVAFHVPSDPFAPFTYGAVIVPVLNYFVVNVSGSRDVVRRANMLTNNDAINQVTYTDPYTTAANAVNGGVGGLMPFYLPGPQSGPWEWYDSTATVNYAIASGLPAANGTQAYMGSLQTNPNMSKAKALAYIDTMQGYLAPRMAKVLNLPGAPIGIKAIESSKNSVSVYPNPAVADVKITSNETIATVYVYDAIGNLVKEIRNVNATQYSLERKGLETGIYLVKTMSDKNHQSIQKIVLQ
ncbi:MAG: T9SS type A sorting domain-containing protein [Bacteroidetes bacterium]|nr:T9SS type A sorting domain-containing protein [Bacteroidota bacterium]